MIWVAIGLIVAYSEVIAAAYLLCLSWRYKRAARKYMEEAQLGAELKKFNTMLQNFPIYNSSDSDEVTQ